MSGADVWQDVILLDKEGKQVGRARVPKRPFLPGIILWSNRYFRFLSVNNSYLETSCYLVPVDGMYAQGEPAPSKAQPGPKK